MKQEILLRGKPEATEQRRIGYVVDGMPNFSKYISDCIPEHVQCNHLATSMTQHEHRPLAGDVLRENRRHLHATGSLRSN
jgi:hypothetical protein